MRRVIPPSIKFVYANEKDSEERLSIAYNRIFSLAKQNLVAKRAIISPRTGSNLIDISYVKATITT